ncbi:MAG: outer membrane lipoprotein carrier protein LolA [Prevotella sp.]|nr:outer membrane lipoprotein carrier protein LolA [Prevotella sp.]MBP5508803.1 outer membrane lipoprotein carrier protein LolA [Prevotella sp.]
MKRIKLLILMALVVCVHSYVQAQAVNEVEIKQKINQAAAALNTMQCDFIQTKHLRMLNDKMVSKGKMYYQKSDKLRWEYVTPYAYVFILNKDKVLVRNKGRNDVIDVNRNKVFKEVARIMMSSVVGNCLSDERNFKTSISESQTEWLATLLPLRKDMRQMFQKIILHFNKQKSYVVKVELFEKNGDHTTIDLKNVRCNDAISANTFVVN